MKAVYSIAYMEVRRTDKEIVRGWVWAAWWSGEPCGSPWCTPDSFGVVEQRWGTGGWTGSDAKAEIAADEALRAPFAARNEVVETRRICGSFALAASREHAGRSPNYRKPTPPARPRARGAGDDRPPTMTAKDFFEAHEREVEERLRRAQAEAQDHWAWWREHAAGSPAGRQPRVEVAHPRALTELGLDVKATAADVRRAFRHRALVDHPDRGGTSESFRRLVKLRDQALGEIVPTGP